MKISYLILTILTFLFFSTTFYVSVEAKPTTSPSSVPPIDFDRSEKNNFGGNNYYKNGKLVGKGQKNNFNSQTIYGKGGVITKGQKPSKATGNEYFRKGPVNSSTNNNKKK